MNSNNSNNSKHNPYTIHYIFLFLIIIIHTIINYYKRLYTYEQQIMSNDIQENTILTQYPTLIPLDTYQPVITTEQYNQLFDDLSIEIIHLLSHDTIIHGYIEQFDTSNRLLKGFTVQHNYTFYKFLLSYSGEWLINHQPTTNKEIIALTNKSICNSWELLNYTNTMKGYDTMTNKERLLLEVSGVELNDKEVEVYLQENGVSANDKYDASSNLNKRAIYNSALAILNSIANQPHTMKSYKQDDMSVYDFAKFIQKRIDQLTSTIQSMPTTDSKPSNYFNLFM